MDDFAGLLETVRPFAEEGLCVQRYRYLRDENLALLKQEWKQAEPAASSADPTTFRMEIAETTRTPRQLMAVYTF